MDTVKLNNIKWLYNIDYRRRSNLYNFHINHSITSVKTRYILSNSYSMIRAKNMYLLIYLSYKNRVLQQHIFTTEEVIVLTYIFLRVKLCNYT